MSSLSTIKTMRFSQVIWTKSDQKQGTYLGYIIIIIIFLMVTLTSLKVTVDFLTPSIFKNLVLSKTHKCEEDSRQGSRLN